MWRVIPSHPLYEASDTGDIRRRDTGRVLSLVLHPSGYIRACLWTSNKRVNKGVHRLVCEAFCGPPPTDKHHAAHRNGTKTDNSADNLRWLSKLENEHEKRDHGTVARGSKCGGAKLTEHQVMSIKRDLELLPLSGRGTKIRRGALLELANKYGVTTDAIYLIKTGVTWRHL